MTDVSSLPPHVPASVAAVSVSSRVLSPWRVSLSVLAVDSVSTMCHIQGTASVSSKFLFII